jgi:hypothetical protein
VAAPSRAIARAETVEPSPRLAVLIDADNAQPAVIGALLAEIASLGEAAVKRIYGDFTSSRSAQWKQVLNQFAIKPVQQFAYSTGKNATDSTLIIDAMDLLYTRRFEGFCLVSSDSDFTGLALRIREEGLTVYGFGERKTPEAFRNACHKFLFTEVLRPEPLTPAHSAGESSVAPSAVATAAAPATAASNPRQPAAVSTGGNGHARIPVALFRRAFEQSSDEQGWAHLGLFGSYLTKLRPDFDARNFGYKKLSDLARARRDLFEVDERKVAGAAGKVLYIRIRSTTT